MTSIIHENTKSQQLVRCNNGENFTTSEIIAEGTQNEHRAVLQLIRTYQSDLEEFNPIAFEMSKGKALPQGGFGKSKQVALLNEDQATFLMTLMKNNKIVVDFKKRLVKAFRTLVNQKNDSLPASFAEALRLAADQAEQLEKLEIQNKKMLPVVERHKAFTSATGLMKFSEAAKTLCNMGIETGQNRLIKWLRNNGYLFLGSTEAKQTYIEQGLFKTKAVTYKHHLSGEEVVTTQTYITSKGLSKFAKEMSV